MDRENQILTLKGIIVTLKKIPKTLRLLWYIDRKDTVIVVGFHSILGVFPILTVLLSQVLINNLVKKGVSLNKVLAVFLIYMAVTLLSELFTQFSGYFQNLFQFDIQYRLKYKLMEQCTCLNLEDFEDPQTYDRVEKLMGEVTYKPYQMFTAIIGIIRSFITMVSSVILIFSWHPIFALFLLFTPLASILYFLRIGQSEFIMMWDRAKEERKSWYLSYLITHDFSFKEINLFGTRPYFMEQYWKISEKFIHQNKEILKRKTVFNVIYEIVLQGISVFIIGVSVVEAFYKKIQVGNVLSYIRSVSLIQNNSQSIMEGIYIAYNCSLYMEQLYAFLEEKEPMKGEEFLISLKGEVKEIRLDNLTFQYKSSNTDDALKGVSLQIKQGDHIAIVGKNGSGKSTIAKIIAGLYPVSKGQLFINQIDITNLDMNEYKQKISVLFQDFIKYEMPVRENIGLSQVEDLDNLDKMRKIASQVGLDFLESDETLNLSMQLGSWFDDGRQLSQGQWQKIALCRTFFRDASVYILDEPNSALDPVSEKIILDLFFSLTKNQIGIFISHKINAAKLADCIVVMDDGRIVDTGTHDLLMKNCSQYRDLYYAENYTEEEKAEQV